MSPGSSLVLKLDKLLEEDKDFSTRAGLRFMTELLRDSIDVIEKASVHIDDARKEQEVFDDRLKEVEDTLNNFLEQREQEHAAAMKDKEKQDSERSKWRWAFIAPSAALLITEVFRFVSTFWKGTP